MLHDKVRLTALAGCALAVLATAGCGARAPVDTAPPAEPAPMTHPGPPPELLGAPPAADGLLGGPAAPPAAVADDDSALTTWRRADGTLVTAMAPIANPAERAVRAAPEAEAEAEADAELAPVRRRHAAAPAAHADVHAAARAAVPAAPKLAAKPARKAPPPPAPVLYPTAEPAPKPVVAAAPAPLKPVAVDKPAIVAKAPVAAPVAPAAPARSPAKIQQLQAAVAPAATQGAVMASGASLATGQPGQVTLSLPATLGEMIRTEAAKLGLGKAARKTSAYAELQGEGYEVTPNGRQTAVVRPGEPATFAWNVTPTPAAKGPLKTQFGATLNGAKPAQDFALGAIARQVAPVPAQAQATPQGFRRALSDLKRFQTIDVPGVGRIPGRSLLGGLLVLLALLILVAISRGATAASQARAERRRRFRGLTGHGPYALDLDAARRAEAGAAHPPAADPAAPAPKEHDPFASPLAGQGAPSAPANSKDLEPLH
ncbi:hypothetical protein [Caulobacter sp. LARHSG274]